MCDDLALSEEDELYLTRLPEEYRALARFLMESATRQMRAQRPLTPEQQAYFETQTVWTLP